MPPHNRPDEPSPTRRRDNGNALLKSVVDLFTGLYTAVAILAALYQREKSGKGAHIDMALFDTQLAAGFLGQSTPSLANLLAGQLRRACASRPEEPPARRG